MDRGTSPHRTRRPTQELEIVTSLYDGYTAKCSCGWSSDEMATNSAAVRKGVNHLKEVKGL